MSLNSTPSANRVHIGIFGRRNAGKSSVINAITGQDLAIVSDVKGTTTDPVSKAMELLPLGPVVLIDTPGLDDTGLLGNQRIRKALQVLRKTDIAILVIDSTETAAPEDMDILQQLEDQKIPYVIVLNKSDIRKEHSSDHCSFPQSFPDSTAPILSVSAVTMENIEQLKDTIAKLVPENIPDLPIVGDLLHPGDFAVLITPIDSSAPKGRLILPQQQTIRDILDADAIAIVTKETSFSETLASLKQKPRIVITDSQVFAQADAATPNDILLTSFSILFARYKGSLETLVVGASRLNELKDGDNILMAEGCTHHRQCDDIGRVKLPKLLRKYTGRQLNFTYMTGTEFPEDLSPYQIIIHCGGCVLNEKEMKYRIQCAKLQNIPITNYGISIAFMQGILARSLKPFPQIAELLTTV